MLTFSGHYVLRAAWKTLVLAEFSGRRSDCIHWPGRSVRNGMLLATMNDFIAAYAQVEPLEKEYDQQLQSFSDLFRTASERDSHRSLFDLERVRGKHHPESWEKMSRIMGLVRQINEITKREISVVHAMASLPEPERARFWHEQFMPLAAEEHALREELQAVGQEQPDRSSAQ